MAEKWYPMVDYLLCTDCGTCVSFCPNNVYDIKKAPSPVVVHPAACVDHCHGCGNICPQGAISYVGDDTGWQSIHAGQGEEALCGSGCGCDSGCGPDCDSGCDCGSGCGSDCGCEGADPETTMEEAVIDYLYLDLVTCDRCMGTFDVLAEAVKDISPALEAAGYHAVIRKTHITDAEMAGQHLFISSPTIRVNGQDICLQVRENACTPCGEISGQATQCRLFVHDGKEYEVPTKTMLARALLKATFTQEEAAVNERSYHLPGNLKAFFDGKGNNTNCEGGGKCC